jgi:hypothetical protein
MKEQDFQKLINQRIEEFVADITELARNHAVQTLAAAIGVSDLGPRGGGSAGRRKRSPGELERLQDRLADHIKANPGEKMQDIAGHFDLAPRELTLPMKKLIAAGEVRTEGRRRATRYFPAGRRKKG